MAGGSMGQNKEKVESLISWLSPFKKRLSSTLKSKAVQTKETLKMASDKWKRAKASSPKFFHFQKRKTGNMSKRSSLEARMKKNFHLTAKTATSSCSVARQILISGGLGSWTTCVKQLPMMLSVVKRLTWSFWNTWCFRCSFKMIALHLVWLSIIIVYRTRSYAFTF